MADCLFATDLHGRVERYEKLIDLIQRERPRAVFLGGDLLDSPSLGGNSSSGLGAADFVSDFLASKLAELRRSMGSVYPRLFLILGNDDGKFTEAAFHNIGASGLWSCVHGRWARFGDLDVLGYSFIPPSPFRLKDWEKYDVSRYVDPGCTGPGEGYRSVPERPHDVEYGTIAKDLDRLTEGRSLERAVLLSHCPPYQTSLDRAALDGQIVEHVPLDIHIGSIAIRRLIESRQPLLTLHGHVHESARLTGSWRDRIGRTHMFNAAHDGPELAVVRFNPDRLDESTRELL